MGLETLPGGTAVIWDDIARQKLTALHAVIRASATDRPEAERLLTFAATHPLAHFFHNVQAACLALLVSILAPAQGEATPSEPAVDPMPLVQFFTALEAQADRDLRRAGVTPEDKAAKAAQRQGNLGAGLDPDFDRDGLRALTARHGA